MNILGMMLPESCAFAVHGSQVVSEDLMSLFQRITFFLSLLCSTWCKKKMVAITRTALLAALFAFSGSDAFAIQPPPSFVSHQVATPVRGGAAALASTASPPELKVRKY